MEILRYDRGTHPKERKYDMKHWNERGTGLLLCLCIAIPCWMLGRALPVIGGPVFAILAGMAIALLVWIRAGLRRASPTHQKQSCNMP